MPPGIKAPRRHHRCGPAEGREPRHENRATRRAGQEKSTRCQDSTDGVEMPIVVNQEAFRHFPDGVEGLYYTKVKLTPVPVKMKVGTMLRDALAQVRGANVTYLVRDDRVEVTTKDRTTVTWLLGESVAGHCQNKPAVDILNELGSQVGCTIVIDKRAVTEAGKQVTVEFRGDATLGAAVRAVTDMVGLKAIVLDGILYVTTPSHADDLRKDAPAAVNGEDPLWPDWRRLPRQSPDRKKQDGVE
jgi:hypothetical protein